MKGERKERQVKLRRKRENGSEEGSKKEKGFKNVFVTDAEKGRLMMILTLIFQLE